MNLAAITSMGDDLAGRVHLLFSLPYRQSRPLPTLVSRPLLHPESPHAPTQPTMSGISFELILNRPAPVSTAELWWWACLRSFCVLAPRLSACSALDNTTTTAELPAPSSSAQYSRPQAMPPSLGEGGASWRQPKTQISTVPRTAWAIERRRRSRTKVTKDLHEGSPRIWQAVSP
jgi:hypothetical protein